MLSQEKSTKQSKSFAAGILMRDFKMASLVEEARNSPVGSTSRKRATALLKSLKMARENRNRSMGVMFGMDGMGGPGDVDLTKNPYQTLTNPNVATTTPQVGAISPTGNISGAPQSYNDIIAGIQAAFPGQNVTTPILNLNQPQIMAKDFGVPTSGTVGAASQMYPIIQSDKVWSLFSLSQIDEYEPLAPGGATSTKVGGMEQIWNKTKKRTEDRYEFKGNKWIDKLNPAPITPTETTSASSASSTVPTETPSTRKLTPEEVTAEGARRALDYGINQLGWKTPTEVEDIGWGADPTVPQEIASAAQQWYSSLDTESQKAYATFYKAVNNGIGPEATWQIIASDRKTLQAMFPNTPLEELPMGASLVRQTNNLESRLREETGLNQLETKMNEIESRGYTALPVLTSYIKGRDEYLGKISSMIDETKTKMTNMDTSDPTVSKSMNQYMNFLYVLKGRQNKRYGDWLNQSIENHNNEVKRVNDQWKILSGRYERELTQKSALLEENYNSWKTLISDLYASVSGLEEKQVESQLKKLQLKKTQQDILIDAINAGISTAGITAGATPKEIKEAEDEFLKVLNESRDLLAMNTPLKEGEASVAWAAAFDSVKNRYPDIDDSVLDQLLNKEKYNPVGASVNKGWWANLFGK